MFINSETRSQKKMNKIQASLFLLLQESVWNNFQNSDNERDIQNLISTRFLEIYRIVTREYQNKSIDPDIKLLNQIIQRNSEIYSNTATTESSFTEELDSDENTLLISENSNDVTPILLVEVSDRVGGLEATLPNHAFSFSSSGINKLRQRVKFGQPLNIGTVFCQGDPACPTIGTACEFRIALSRQDFENIFALDN